MGAIGGGGLAGQFLDARLLDEIARTIAPATLGVGRLRRADLELVGLAHRGVFACARYRPPGHGRGRACWIVPLLLVVVLVVTGRFAARRPVPCSEWCGRGRDAAHGPRVRVAGVVLNRVGTSRHDDALRRACAEVGMPVLGSVPRQAELAVPSRHPGLVTAAEHGARARDAMAALVGEHVDLAAVEALARCAPPTPVTPWDPAAQVAASPVGPRPVVAMAGGSAFTFGYPEHSELLVAAGAQVVTVDPLLDEDLPEATTGLDLPGGFPEEHGEALSANESLRVAVRDLAGRDPRGVRRAALPRALARRAADVRGAARRRRDGPAPAPGLPHRGRRHRLPGRRGGGDGDRARVPPDHRDPPRRGDAGLAVGRRPGGLRRRARARLLPAHPSGGASRAREHVRRSLPTTALTRAQRHMILGVGVEPGIAHAHVHDAVAALGVDSEITAVATVDLRADKPSVLALAAGRLLRTYPVELLDDVEVPNPSAVVRRLIGTSSAAEAAAILAARELGRGELVVAKRRGSG